jgi:hypothetical protein
MGNAQVANDVGNPPDSNTTLGATNSALVGGRLDISVVGRAELHSNDAPPVDDESSGTSSDEDSDGRRPWQPCSNALTVPRDQVQNAPGVAAPTDRQDLHARTGDGVVPCVPNVENGDAGATPCAKVPKRMVGSTQTAAETDQHMPAPVAMWCTTSDGKRRKIGGAGDEQCAPGPSFEDANHRRNTGRSMGSGAAEAVKGDLIMDAPDASTAPNVVPVLKKLKGADDGLPVQELLLASAPPQPSKSSKRNTASRTRKIKQRRMQKAALKALPKNLPLPNKTTGLRDPTSTELQSVKGNADESGTGLQNSLLPLSAADILSAPVGAVQAVRSAGRDARTQSGQTPKRVVQQSTLDAADAKARLLAMVLRHAETESGRAGRAAIAQCEWESKNM